MVITSYTRSTGLIVKHFLAYTLAALSLAFPLSAQVPLTARSLGMGGAYLAVARGQDAVFLNPANLALAGNPPRSFGAFQLAFGASLLGPTRADLWDALEYDNVSDERAREILSRLSNGYAETEMDLRLPIVAYQRGGFGWGLAYGLVNRTSVGHDLLELLFFGYEPERVDYSVGRTGSSGAAFFDLAFAYGRRVGPLTAGVTAHLLRGTSMHQARVFEPIYSSNGGPDIELDVVSTSRGGGFGGGLDVGIAYQPARFFTLSAALHNAVGAVGWGSGRSYKAITFNEDDLPGSTATGILLDFNESSSELACPAPVSDRQRQRACRLARELDDGVQLPRTAQLGAALTLPTRTDVAASFRTDLTGAALGSWWDTMASVGVQQKLWGLGFRAGYATNLQQGSDAARLWSGGFSLGPLHLGYGRVAAERVGYIGSIGLGVPF